MKKRLDPTALIKKANAKLVKKPPKYPKFGVGDTIRVYVRVVEGEKTRVQPFEGLVIRKKSGGIRSSFTVRKIASGVGVERVFPYYSPVIDRIVLVSEGEVRRAKLYYLRGLRGRAGRIKSEFVYRDTEKEAETPEENKSEASEDVAAQEKEAAQA